MGLFDLVREEQEAKKKAEESAKKDTKDAVVEEVEKVETEKEITDIMLQHRHYEFAGTMEYSYIEDDNVLVVTGKQHRKG